MKKGKAPPTAPKVFTYIPPQVSDPEEAVRFARLDISLGRLTDPNDALDVGLEFARAAREEAQEQKDEFEHLESEKDEIETELQTARRLVPKIKAAGAALAAEVEKYAEELDRVDDPAVTLPALKNLIEAALTKYETEIERLTPETGDGELDLSEVADLLVKNKSPKKTKKRGSP